MAYCDIKNPPVFETQVDKWDKTTRDNGEEMAVPIETLFNNTVFNKEKGEKLRGKYLENITIQPGNWSNLTFTISDPTITASSSIDVGYAFDSIPIAQKANIRGRAESGRLVLVAKKLPTAAIIIEEIRILNIREEW